MAKTKYDVIPILDIENAEFAEQYQLGAWWARYGDEQGMVHGGILNPQTNKPWSGMTTLVRLSNPQFLRGYRAGRVWFFYEADEDERRLTATLIMERLSELASERRRYHDEASTVHFSLGCVLGELSGQVCPLTSDEHEQIQEEDRQFLAEYADRQASISQESLVLQEA